MLNVRSASEHLGLPRLTGAKVRIWYRNDGAQKLRLLPHIELLFQIITETDQLWFMQEGAVYQHAGRSAAIANAYGKR